MLRLVLLLLSYCYKRATTSLASMRDQRIGDGYSRYEENEEGGRWSLLTLLTIAVLSLYILGSLGFYAKVHVWDTLSEAQKSMVIESMAANQQML